jgi:hypothetical protein
VRRVEPSPTSVHSGLSVHSGPLSIDIYTFRNLADITSNFFNKFQKLHNKNEINAVNNLIRGSYTTLDADGVKVEHLGMRLLPHHIFIMPKSYYTRLRNKAALTEETGLTRYLAPFLRCFLRSALFKHMLYRRKNKKCNKPFFLADLYTKPIGSPLIINGFP